MSGNVRIGNQGIRENVRRSEYPESNQVKDPLKSRGGRKPKNSEDLINLPKKVYFSKRDNMVIESFFGNHLEFSSYVRKLVLDHIEEVNEEV